MVLVGVAWASILSMPYAMLSNAIPAEKMGFYMGVFNFFIVIPQILASLGLGTLMKSVLGDNPMNAVLLGGCSMIARGPLRGPGVEGCGQRRSGRGARDWKVAWEGSRSTPLEPCVLAV